MSDAHAGQHTAAWIGAGATIVAALVTVLLTFWLNRTDGDDGPNGPDSAAVFLNRDSGPGDTVVQVSGRGFTGQERVVIRFHTEQVGSTTTDSDGGFANVAVTIPTSFSQFAPQQFSIVATGESSLRTGQAPFTITG